MTSCELGGDGDAAAITNWPRRIQRPLQAAPAHIAALHPTRSASLHPRPPTAGTAFIPETTENE